MPEYLAAKTETVSKNRKRGRPPAFGQDMDAAIAVAWGDLIKTKRSVRNKQYLLLGRRAISPDGVDDGKFNERHAWFLGDGKNYRQAVLVELGRIAALYGDATAHAMADKLADEAAAGKFTTTRQAASWLRWCRLSASKKHTIASADGLERLLVATINDYLDKHPDATTALVRRALCGALDYATGLTNPPT